MIDSGYTPTTDEVADRYIRDCVDHIGRADVPEVRREFDRWLARHDAEVAANVLRSLAEKWKRQTWTAPSSYVARWLESKVNRIEQGAAER